jgi:arylsulfatase A
MQRSLFAGVLSIALILGCHIGKGAGGPHYERANVVFLLADDMQWNAIAALGNTEIETPNLDRLVNEGTAFTGCVHQGSPHGAVCMPSRAMIWTGRHLWRRGGDQCGDHQLFAQTMRNAGYETFGAGKWHNGKAALERNFEHLGRTGGGMLHSTEGSGDAYRRDSVEDSWRPDDRARKGHWIEQDGEIAHSSEVWVDEALGFLRSRDTSAPFFAYVGFHGPHDPRQAPTEYLDRHSVETRTVPANFLPEHPFDNGALKLRDEQLAPFPRTPAAVQLHLSEYHAIISHMDAQIGRVLDELDAQGLADETYVVFAADHGLSVGQHGLLGKQSLYDHSLRAPMILRGPGIPRGEEREGLVYLHSLFPTVCDMVGVDAPDSVDAPSLTVMVGDPEERVHETIYSAYADTQRAVRTERFKLILYPQVREAQFFDLARDPDERINRMDGGPVGTIRSLHRELLRWMEVTEDDMDPALLADPWDWNASTLVADADMRRPNVVVILADDLGYGDVQALNADSRIPTPNIDRIAREGMTLTDAHSPSAVCTPTRFGLLTGRYCWRTRLKSGVLWGLSPSLIEPDQPTLGTLMQGAGYHTACVGKWHLGLDFAHDEAGEIDFTGEIGGGPLDHGFDEFFGIPASLDMDPYFYVEGRRIPSPPTEQYPGGRFPGFLRKGLISPDFDPTLCLSQLTDRACRIVDEGARRDQPFFLYFPLTAPHKPVLPEPRFQGATELGPYGDFIVATDHAVGRVLDALDEAGAAGETLVVFTSDNGSFMHRRDANDARDHVDDETIQAFRADRHRANGPWRGTKADIWEAGHHVPFFVRWPSFVEPGGVCDELVCHVDLYATLDGLTGPPDERWFQAHEDGHDISELWFGRGGRYMPSKIPWLYSGSQVSPPSNPVIHHSVNGTFAIRSGRWKLVASSGSGGREKPRGKPFDGTYQLFDIKSDPGETHDVSGRYPGRVERLSQALRRMQRSPARPVQGW